MKDIDFIKELNILQSKYLIKKIKLSIIIDFVYNSIDDLLLNNNNKIVDEILSKIDTKKIELSVLISILVITLPFKNALENRKYFYDKIYHKISLQNKDPEKLIFGLK